ILTDDGRLLVIDYDTALTEASTTTTRTVVGTQFTADLPDVARDDPFLADVIAFARCLAHTLAGDGDGLLDQDQTCKKAMARIKRQLADTDRFADILHAGLAGTVPTCSTWIEGLRAAVTTPPRLRAILGRQARALRRAARLAGARPRLLRAGLAITVLVVVVLGGAFLQQRDETARRTAAATSRALAAASGESADRDAVYSAMLALAAYQAQPTPEAITALFRPYLESQGATAMFSDPEAELVDVQVSRNGGVVAAATASGKVAVWTRARSGETRRINTSRLPDAVPNMALSPDGAALWLVVDDGWLVWFEPFSGQLRRATEIGRGGAIELAVSADGVMVAVVITEGDSRRAVVWNARAGRLEGERALPGTGTLIGVTLGPGGSLVAQLHDHDAAGELVRRVETWGPEDGFRLTVPFGVNNEVVVTPSGDVAVTCVSAEYTHSRYTSIRLADGTELGHAESELPCPGFATDPSGLKVVEKGLYGSGAVLDLRTGKAVSRVRAPLLGDLSSRIVPILTGSGDDLHLVAWQKSRVALLAVPPPDTVMMETSYNFLSRDGDFIVGVAGDGSELSTYRAAGTTPLAIVKRRKPFWPSGDRDFAKTRDDGLVADRVAADRVAVRRLPNLELVREITTAPVRPNPLDDKEAGRADGMFFLSDQLVTVIGHQVEVWDVSSGERAARYDLVQLGHASPDQSVELGPGPTPDRLALLVEGRPDVRVLDAYTGQELVTVAVGDDVSVVLFQKSSSMLLVVRTDGTVEMWDADEERRVFGPLAAENELGRSVGVLDEPGSFVVIDDGRYRIWNVRSVRPRLDLRFGEFQRITSVSGDGMTVLYRGGPAYLGVLQLDAAAWRGHICSVIGQRRLEDHKPSELPPETPKDPLCP
ncbi:MAG TPA: WD40 repeat domain-containing protein, partial [Acidimicrobiales bacterium]|nr:WD40 repeat domain-containing protein [Acidimicrobiales bacterium]